MAYAGAMGHTTPSPGLAVASYTIAELKSNLRQSLPRVQAGMELAVWRRSIRAARIVPVIARPVRRMVLGLGPGSAPLLWPLT